MPRQSPWTYVASAKIDIPMSSGVVSARVSFNHRDPAFHTDNNLGFYKAVDLLDANLSYTLDDGSVTFSVYGKNLTNETTYGNDAVLPDTDRKSVVEGKSVSGRVELGGRRIIKKTK